MKESDWISAEEAQLRLGVRAQTLYAYVSRGHVQVRAHPADARRSLYRATDVDELAVRNGRSRKLADVASAAIVWGEPVLSSAITTVRAGRFFYRGHDAVGLAEDRPLEAVARLLLGEDQPSADNMERTPPPDHVDLHHRLYQMLAGRAAASPPMLGSSDGMIAAEAALLLDLVADAAAGAVLPGPIHQRLANSWGADPHGATADLIRRMMILVADHELNASTFAARVTASTGASLAAAVLSGLSTLSGPRHGGMSAMARRFAAEAELHGARDAVHARLVEGRSLPGFGHPLYPQGDIRAKALLDGFELPASLAALRAAAKDLADVEPNIDFAMMAICLSCGMPAQAPFALFATARSAGWIAHAVEQNRTGKLIRPRARYVGPEPLIGSD
ncbi:MULTISPECIES: citrate synthase [Sphingobium]|uniref:Citrate synthase n=1 Tax=Sphingobium fuliginis ATCC 27551 TaxID=1208342 RepID=A0A5B8CCH0_SPHSA|nr:MULTISPECIES: citrate synthase [Sphingobium]QDC35956.1 citrate synthase [Sphingobium fuliginis ATCC 27551]UXC91026.1 citrate synthase [Sphingobium sp. RSMS]